MGTVASVVLLAVAVVAGLAVGMALPPRRHHRAQPQVRALPLLAVAVVAQVVAAQLEGGAAAAVALAGFAGLLAVAMANLALTGMGVVAVGLAANALVIAVNGGMPVRPEALVEAGVMGPASAYAADPEGPRHLEEDDDRLTVLGDAVPVEPLGVVVSIGDLVLCAGLADVAAHGVRRRRRYSPGPPVIPAADSTRASAAQDWGTAPRPVPSSGSQYSASPEDRAPSTVGAATAADPAHQSR